MTDRPDPRDLPTDPVGSAPPESPDGTRPSLQAIPPQAALAPQPDRNSFEHWALDELLARSRKIDEQQRALDLSGELDRFAKRLEKGFDANFRMLHNAIEAQGKRITATEAGIEQLRDEMRTEIAQLRRRVDQMEAKLDGAEAAPSATG